MTKATKFDMSAKRTTKKLENIEDGTYIFSVRGKHLYEDPSSGDLILFINTSTEEAGGLCPSLRFNVSTEQGNAYLDDFLVALVGEDAEITLEDIDGMQFQANKVTTEDNYHNLTSWKSIDDEVTKAA